MTLSIAEAMQQAHEAMNGGDFQSASQTGSQLVRQFPGYARAHGLLGEAYREQGKLKEARESFAASLARYQRASGTYLGLGLIAEDEGSAEHALAFCQVAWELAPEQRQLREPLSRVAMRRYGADGDLQLSHAALAQLHANASRLRRAVDEYRRALATLPERVDLKLGMAECLWRMGHDAEALQLAREVLESFPESAAALAMAADVEHRTGNTSSADGLLRQLRAVDPDGSIVAGMLATNSRANRAFLEVAATAIPELSDVVETVPVERPRIAPAPDFDYRPSRSELPAASMEELEPISLEEFGGDATGLHGGAGAAVEFDFASLGVEGDLTPISIEELGGLPEGFQPISPEEFGGVSSDLPAIDSRDLELDFEIEGLESVTSDVITASDGARMDDLLSLDIVSEAASEPEPFDAGALGFDDFSDEASSEADATSEPFDAAVLGFEDFSDAADQQVAPDLEPFDAATLGFEDFSGVDEELSAAPSPRAEQFDDWQLTETDSEPVNDLASLAASLQSDVADALTRAGEIVTRDEDVDDSRPPTVLPGGYTTMLQSLDDSGLAPFDPRSRDGGSSDEAMPSMEMDDQLLEQSRPPSLPGAADSLTADWDSIDDEILRAMPEGYQPGYTEELRSLDDIGLAPFEIEEQDSDLHGIAPFNPFTTEPAVSPFLQPPAADTESQPPALEASAERHVDDELLSGLEPFSFEEFDSPGVAPATGEHRPPWDMGGSAIPSDEDLDTLLAFEDDMPEAAELAPAAEHAGVAEDVVAPSVPPQEQLHEIGDVSAIEREIESDWDRTAAEASADEESRPFEQSFAVTRDLSHSAGIADDHEETAAAYDAAASKMSTSELIGSLRPGTEVFSRAREAKQGLVAEGLIGGNRELLGDLSTDDLTEAQDVIATRELERPDVDFDDDSDTDITVGFDSSRDVATLRAEIEITPGNDDLHWYLAEALREQGEMADAYTEYRWLIRNAPERHDAVLEVLQECVDRDLSPELAHRLLGDVYRRRGDVARASSHAALSLQQHRRSGRR